jgi:hypothetical protein
MELQDFLKSLTSFTFYFTKDCERNQSNILLMFFLCAKIALTIREKAKFLFK